MVGSIPLSSMRIRAMLSVRVMPVIVAYASPRGERLQARKVIKWPVQWPPDVGH
jgi:hypothetical protein